MVGGRLLAGVPLRVAAAATLCGFLLGIENWVVRAQSFSVLLFALTWWLLWRYAYGRGGSRSLALLPVIVALWANLHGAFPLGLVAQGLFVVGLLASRSWSDRPALNGLSSAIEGFRGASWPRPPLSPLLLALLASLPATLVTPYGLGIYGYLVTIATDPSIQTLILEWGGTTLSALPGRVFYAVMLAMLLLLGLARRWPHPVGLLSLLVLGWLSASLLRSVLWSGFAKLVEERALVGVRKAC